MFKKLLPAAAAALLVACSGGTPAPEVAPAPVVPAGPTAADADAFVAGLNADLRKLLPYVNSAAWLQATYITDDSQMISSKANEEMLGWQSKNVEASKKFNGVQGLSADTQRALTLIKNVSAPAPSDPALQAELSKIMAKMEANYGSGKWCKTEKECLNLGDIEKIINDPKATPEARAEAWKGWQETARPIRKDYQRFVEIINQGAKEMGFANAGEVWRGGYDMAPDAFAAETDRLWSQVKPLYDELHCHVRAKLNAQYGDAVVPKDGLIPSHLLGNMWAQQWSNIYPQLEPHKGVGSLDVTAALQKQRNELYAALVKANPKAKTPVELAELSY